MSVLDFAECAAEPEQPERSRPSQADRLVHLARNLYDFGVSPGGDTFGVAKDGPRIARIMRGSAQSIRAELAREYFREYSKAPSSTALSDALAVLQGFASIEEPEPLYIRQAAVDGTLWVDLGDTSGAAVRITPSGWEIANSAPVTFRRSELTGPFPRPVPGGDLEELRAFLNVDDNAWHLITGWLVSAYFPEIPHPLLVLTGEQGTAKTTTGRMLASLIDPGPAPLRTAPKDVSEWVTTADASYLVGFDNMSGLSGWLSDAICRAVTGDGLPRRKLYSDSELVVSAFRKLVMLTGIDLGNLSADLIDRALFVELERIPAERRRLDSELARDFAEACPRILGGLFDLVSAAMRELPGATLDSYPRMADHARVLWALDLATEGVHLACYELAAGRAMAEAAEGSPVAEAVIAFMSGRSRWTGTASELLECITPREPPKRWPAAPNHLSGLLKRLAPVLRARGVEVDTIRTHDGRAIVLGVTHDDGDDHSQLYLTEKEEREA